MFNGSRKKTARQRFVQQNNEINRKEEQFTSFEEMNAGFNGIDLTSPYYKERVASGERLIGLSRIENHELLTNTLAQIDTDRDNWYMNIAVNLLGDVVKMGMGAKGVKS